MKRTMAKLNDKTGQAMTRERVCERERRQEREDSKRRGMADVVSPDQSEAVINCTTWGAETVLAIACAGERGSQTEEYSRRILSI